MKIEELNEVIADLSKALEKDSVEICGAQFDTTSLRSEIKSKIREYQSVRDILIAEAEAYEARLKSVFTYCEDSFCGGVVMGNTCMSCGNRDDDIPF